MRQSLLTMSIMLAGLLGFVSYCWVLIDWYQAMQLGHYERQPLALVLESVVIIAYCYLAFRFIQVKLKSVRSPDYRLPGSTKVGATTPLPGWFTKPTRPIKRPITWR
ncbi:hypothetical protein [Spirosoma harenae]